VAVADERLDNFKKKLIKYACLLEHFSIQMLRDLMGESLKRGARKSVFSGGKLAHDGANDSDDQEEENRIAVQVELAELIAMDIIEPVHSLHMHTPTVSATEYIRTHDPQAKGGYTMQCLTLKLEVRKMLLEGDVQNWSAAIRRMRIAGRQSILRGAGTAVGTPALFEHRKSMQFRAGTVSRA